MKFIVGTLRFLHIPVLVVKEKEMETKRVAREKNYFHANHLS